jgi:hypothetical protein
LWSGNFLICVDLRPSALIRVEFLKADEEGLGRSNLNADFRRLEEKIFNANEEGMERECSHMACLENLDPLSMPYLLLFTFLPFTAPKGAPTYFPVGATSFRRLTRSLS